MAIKLNLHAHTFASPDSVTTLKDLENLFDSEVVDQVAITDHDEIHAAQQALEKFGPTKIIVGSEITTAKGKHVIGLFLKELVKKGLSVEDTAKAIRDQGGLVYIPHPFEPKRGIGQTELDNLLNKNLIDIVEGFNSWVYRSILNPQGRIHQNEQAWIYCKKNDLPVVSSSDAHTTYCFKNAYTEIEKVATRDNLIKLINKAEVKHIRNFSSLNSKIPIVALKALMAHTVSRRRYNHFA